MSYGNFCAKKSGLPEAVLKRAEEIAEYRANGKPIRRVTNKETADREARYQKMAEEFIKFDVSHGDVTKFLNDIVFNEKL